MIDRTPFIGLISLIMLVGCHKTQTLPGSHAILQPIRLSKDETPRINSILRAKAAELHAEDIKELRFTRSQFQRYADEPILIKNKKEIGRYITALRHAYGRSLDLGNGIDTLEIVFQSYQGKAKESQLFHFNLSNDLDCFGPEFRKEALALQAQIAAKDKAAEAARKSRP